MNYCVDCNSVSKSDENCDSCGSEYLINAKMYHRDGRRYCDKCSAVYRWNVWKCGNCGEIFVSDYNN